MKNKAVSAIIGVILMVAITIAIAATIFIYVQGYYDVKVDAFKSAHNFIKTKLNSSDIQFSKDAGTRTNADVWVVTGGGECENASHFSYTVSMTHDFGWSLKDCEISWE
jgi:flagellin-like protein